MNPWVVEIGLGAVSLGAWAALYGVMVLATRPRGITAAPASQDLGPEPPAVASMLGSGWDLTEDAAEATLLDLAARRVLEFRQPSNDPMHTTIHIRDTNPTGLSPYERRIFDRVAGLAEGGLVPMTALTFRDDRKARRWWRALRAEIVADARTRGLSRRRFSTTIVGILVAAAGLATVGVAVAVAHNVFRGDEEDPIAAVVGFSIITFAGLSLLAGHNIGERDTPAGREVAARWLGVRDWLRGHEAFAELPPSAVAVWDRYLGYGAALGATHLASSVIDLGMGSRRRVWSSYGGTWHRVRVRYPRFWPRYGHGMPTLILRVVLAVAAGYVLVRWWRGLVSDVAEISEFGDNPITPVASPLSLVGYLAGVALLAYGGYALIRVLIDAIAPAMVTGQVLWMQVWREHNRDRDSRPRAWLHYLAIDDGRGERTTAWGLPTPMAVRCDTGDTVTAKVRRWSRRVVDLTLVERGTRGHTDGTNDSAEDDNVALAAAASAVGSAARAVGTALRGPAIASELLTAEEVGQALGMQVKRPDAPAPGPISTIMFATADRNRTVLLLQVADGAMGRMAWRSNSRGAQLPGIGDGAWTKGNRAVARRGETTVVLTLMKDAKGRTAQLPWLLQQAVARLS